MLDFQIHHEDPDFTIASFANLLVWNFRIAGTLTYMQRAELVHKDLLRRYPSGFGVMTIVSEKVGLTMPAEARQKAGEIVKTFQQNYCAISDVVEGAGLKAATVRGVMAGIRLFGKNTCPVKVYADPEEAARWITPHLLKAQGKVGLDAGFTQDLIEATRRVRKPATMPGARASNA